MFSNQMSIFIIAQPMQKEKPRIAQSLRDSRFFTTYVSKVIFTSNYFFLTVTFSSFQISSTYSWIVLSDENLPEEAIFKIALLAQAASSL